MIASLAALSSFRRILVPSLALAFAPAAVAGNVHTVGGTGGDFADIQSAVTASIDGDVVLVRPGSYSGFTIANKTLAVAADTGAVVEITSQVMVQGVGVGKKVVLAGLNLVALPENVYFCLYLNANSGSVRVQGCQIGRANMRRGTAAWSRLCNDVAFVGCTLQGANGYGVDPLTGFHYGGGSGEAGLYATGGQVALYDCDLVGGLGESGEDRLGIPGGNGGSGCFLEQGAFLFASGTSFRGRNAGNGSSAFDCFDNPGADGGNGGDGIGSVSTVNVVLLDCTTTAGAAGAGGTDACGPGGSPGRAGAPIDLGGSSTLDQLPLSARKLVMPTPVRESTPVHVTLTGEPGEMAYLTMWADARFLYSPAMSGVLLEKAPLIRRVRLGVVPATGVLDKNIVLPDLGPGVQGKTYFFQAYFLDPANVVTLGSPAFVVALDSAF